MASTSKSQIEKLLELKQLHEAGILTKEEVEIEKKKILETNSETSKESHKREVPVTPNDQQERTEIIENFESEAIETAEDAFFDKNKKLIFGGIALLLIVVGFFAVPKIVSHSDSANISLADSKDIVQKDIYIKGKIEDKVGFSMHLQQTGNEIDGTEHYDSQNTDATLSIKGTIDDNGAMTLYEYDGSVNTGTYNGNLEDVLYSGTFTNSRGKIMSFSAKVLTKEDIENEKDAIKRINDIGTIIANVNGKIYYIDKSHSEKRYESEGENSGKLYIYDIANETTSSERILIPSGEMYSIVEYKYRDMKITFVLYDVARNGIGIGYFCTEVSQYNIRTGKWKDIAEGCAKAEFIDNNKKIKITTAEITNYDEATAAYEYEYEFTEEIITL